MLHLLINLKWNFNFLTLFRPCDVFAHCTNTYGSFFCTCYPGYDGDGFTCHDINECEDPELAKFCVKNAECTSTSLIEIYLDLFHWSLFSHLK